MESPEPVKHSLESFLSDIQTSIGNGLNFKDIGKIHKPCFYADFFLKMGQHKPDAGSETLRSEITIKMTIQDLIQLSVEKDELDEHRKVVKRLGDAEAWYRATTGERQDKKLVKFANMIGLTNGKRRAVFNESYIFSSYLNLINGVDRVNKKDAVKIIEKKYGIQSPKAVVSHLKRHMRKIKKRCPEMNFSKILP